MRTAASVQRQENKEQRAESNEQRAESREPFAPSWGGGKLQLLLLEELVELGELFVPHLGLQDGLLH